VVFAVLAAVAAFVHDRLRRRLARRSVEEHIASQLNALIVPVTELGPADGRSVVAVPDFASLAGLARFLERPILYEVHEGNRTYAVDDDVRRYVTQAIDRRQNREPRAPTWSPTPAATTDAREHRARGEQFTA
jgi:hypothetical protein